MTLVSERVQTSPTLTDKAKQWQGIGCTVAVVKFDPGNL